MSLPGRLALALGLTMAVAAAPAAAAGNVPVHPIVLNNGGFLLGGSANGDWMPAEIVASKLEGGERYRHYSLNSALGDGVGPPPKSYNTGACPETIYIEMSLPADDSVVSLAADWNALPRQPKAATTTLQVYRDAATVYLTRAGLRDPAVDLEQVIRVDLQGDGVDEVLLSANHREPREGELNFDAVAGDYSFLLLRRLRDGKVETLTLASDIHATPANSDVNMYYRIAAVLDLNGDGTMEIVVETSYYEGSGAAVFEVSGLEVKPVLEAGCGA